MLDPVVSAGLASSIITFLDLAYKVGKRTHDYSKLLGELPPDLQSCRDCIEVLIRGGERLRARLDIAGDDGSLGPVTLFESDLLTLFENASVTAHLFLRLLSEIEQAKLLPKVLKVVRNEGKFKMLRDKLDHHILSLVYVLQSHDNHQSAEIL